MGKNYWFFICVWMSEWMGECEAKCKALLWPLGLWKRYLNAVHLALMDNFKGNFLNVSIFCFAPSDSRCSNCCISAKYSYINWPMWLVLWSRVTYCNCQQTEYSTEVTSTKGVYLQETINASRWVTEFIKYH